MDADQEANLTWGLVAHHKPMRESGTTEIHYISRVRSAENIERLLSENRPPSVSASGKATSLHPLPVPLRVIT